MDPPYARGLAGEFGTRVKVKETILLNFELWWLTALHNLRAASEVALMPACQWIEWHSIEALVDRICDLACGRRRRISELDDLRRP
jgi:hypothetical protein